MNNNAINQVLDFGIVFAPWIFILIYSFITPWWRNIVSRAVCGLMASISMIPMARIIAILAGLAIRGTHDEIYTWLQVGTKIPVVITSIVCVYVLLKLQKEKRNGILENRKT